MRESRREEGRMRESRREGEGRCEGEEGGGGEERRRDNYHTAHTCVHTSTKRH